MESQSGSSGSKNIVALVLMVAVLGASGFYIYSRYQKNQDDQAKLNNLVPEVSADEIRAARATQERQAETMRKFAPLLLEARKKNREAQAGEGETQKSPFPVPSNLKSGEGSEAAPAEAAPAEAAPADEAAPPPSN
jgi:uncharacterized protein HemX